MDGTTKGWRRLRIAGVVTLRCNDFKSQLERLEQSEDNVLIDLTGVEAMESAAIGALMHVRTQRERRGKRCRFDARLPGLRRILQWANAELTSSGGVAT